MNGDGLDGVDLGIDGLTNYVQIGRGGFATVYSARHERLGRTVAVKVLRHLDDDGVRRFEREAKTLAKLGSHQNLAVIYDSARTVDGNPCFIMEFVDGGSLADELRRLGTIEPRMAIAHAQQVARALVHTHNLDIVHRDIKPSNILLTSNGQAKLSDFGIAVMRSNSATLNAATFEHAAPEVFRAAKPSNDPRIDLYSLASTLFNLIDGSSPYHVSGEPSHESLLHRVLYAPIPTTDRAANLDGFWTTALAKEPEDRFQTASEMLAALTALGRDMPKPPGSRPARSRQKPLPPPPPASSPRAPNGASQSPPPPVAAPPPAGQPPSGTTVAAQQPRRALTPHELVILDEAATSSDVSRRRRVAELTTTQAVLFGLAQDRDDACARTAIDRLTDTDLLGQLVDPSRPKRTRVLAAARIGSGPLAAQLADDPDADVRAALASGVLDLDIFRRLIKDRSEKVRSAAFSHIQDSEVLDFIVSSEHVEDRRAVAQHVKSPELLLKLARDDDVSVRRAALAGLDQRRVLELAASDAPAVSATAIEFVADVESLHHLSRHAMPHVRSAALERIAARAAAGSGTADPAATDLLSRIAGDIDHPQWNAALDRIGEPRVLARLARSNADRVAERALTRLDDQMLLAELAHDPGYRFRARVVGRLADPATVEPLANDNDPEVAAIASSAMAQLRQRDEQLGTARIVMIALVVFAVVVTLVRPDVWPLAVLFIGLVVAGHRWYRDSR